MSSRKRTDDDIKKLLRRGGKTPLEFMLQVMNNTNVDLAIRLEAAKVAAPYVHSKMPIGLNVQNEITIIPPFLPSRKELAADFINEIDGEVVHDS